LRDWFAARGEPRFRARQVLSWAYRRLARSYDEMTDLPAALREGLEREMPLGEAEVAVVQEAEGGVRKALLVYPDKGSAETVLLPYAFGASTCLSSQVGCRQGCRFCATGVSAFTRSLRMGEIVEQFIWAARAAQPEPLRRLVMMGAGEPLDNYDEVLRFLRHMHDPETFGLSYRHMTVSTVGLAPQIRALAAAGLPLNLALSLHATQDELRSALIPENRRYPIAEILAATDHYFAVTGRRITYEFLLIGRLNDSLEEADRLAQLVQEHPGHVNLIPLNPVPEFPFEAPSPQRVSAFRQRLQEAGVNATVRRTLGQEVQAACGQLRRHYDREGQPVPPRRSWPIVLPDAEHGGPQERR
jgi:23S rRNA (adenine2503-C2)-methyltransferase